jgi:oligoendopeptidase F
VPVVRRIEQRRAKDLGLARLRPWDMNVDPLNRAPLKPFTEARELVDGCLRITERVDSRFGGFIQTMRDLELLNLESRKGKAPGGYQSSLAEARLPFVFMNAVGLDGDVRTLLHEAGHAFHVFATREEPIGHYRHAPIEFCEVASMSMELLGGEYLSVFYPNPEDLDRSRKKHLEGVIDILPWIARVDAFQHWIYTRPNHTVDERRAYWVELHRRFGGIEDWSDFEHAQATSWHRQLHIFELPFYYIEYAIAQLGALQVWINAKKDFRAAVADYWSALQLGGSRPLPELFARAKVKFDFGPSALEPLMAAVEAELEKL